MSDQTHRRVRCRKVPWLRLLVALSVILTLTAYTQASSPSLIVEYAADMGTFNGKGYVYAEGLLSGRAPGGRYSVPVILIYPSTGSNGFALVDFVNPGSRFHSWRDAQNKPVVCDRGDFDTQHKGRVVCESGENEGHRFWRGIGRYSTHIMGDYLYRSGWTVFQVQWAKMVTDYMGPEPPDGSRRRRLAYGTIAENADGYEILRDAGRFVKNPGKITGNATSFAGVDAAVTFAFSSPGFLQREFLRKGHNEEADGSLIYDGHLITGAGGLCLALDVLRPGPCPSIVTGDSKVLALDTQSEPERLAGFLSRDDGSQPNYRKWELAGVCHLPTPIFALTYIGVTNQNPISYRPVFKAALNSLKEWIEADVDPAPSAHIDGSVGAENVWTTDVDADGNAKGGVRLPHMPRTLADGSPAGAPLGVYGARDLSSTETLIILSGTFDPFTESELAARYPTRTDYVRLVTAAADELLAEGYILKEDRDQYVAEAKGVQIPEVPALDGGSDSRMDLKREAIRLQLVSIESELPCLVCVGPGAGSPTLAARYPTRTDYVRLVTAAADELLAEGYILKEDRDQYVAEAKGVQIPEVPALDGGSDSRMDLEEGGEIRLQLVSIDDGPVEVRTHAWFASAQEPGARPLARPPENWNTQDGPDLCRNLRPMSKVSSRTYVDAGATVHFTGTSDELQLSRQADVQDFATEEFHDIVYLADIDATDVIPGDFDFTVSGGPGMPQKTFTSALRLPGSYKISFPDMTDIVSIPKKGDFPFIWSGPSDRKGSDYAFVTFSDFIGPVYYCIGPQSGQMTIPSRVVEDLPLSGQLVHGVLSYRVVDYKGRRLDFIGINSHSTRYFIEPRF